MTFGIPFTTCGIFCQCRWRGFITQLSLIGFFICTLKEFRYLFNIFLISKIRIISNKNWALAQISTFSVVNLNNRRNLTYQNRKHTIMIIIFNNNYNINNKPISINIKLFNYEHSIKIICQLYKKKVICFFTAPYFE